MIKILNPGFYTTIQDLGRFGYQEYGVPMSGAMDAASARGANLTLNNKPGAALLEMTMIGPTLQFTTQTNICLSGADMSPSINNKHISMNAAIPIKPKDVLSFGRLQRGCRAYLAISGGILTPKILGSRSMYLGITDLAKLSEQDTIAIEKNIKPVKLNASLRIDNSRIIADTIGVFKGPEYNLLTTHQRKALFAKQFTVSHASNRMAYQLTEHFSNRLKPIISSLVLPGTVQLTPSGRLIILMRDCQTTGGYPRILQLQQKAIDILAQKLINASINFELIKE